MKRTLEASGQRGSWFAEVDGERLPCVHHHWTRPEGGRMVYDDPTFHPADVQFAELLAALQAGERAILTYDKTNDGGKTFERVGYIALFKITDVCADGGHLRFTFSERLSDLR